MRNCWFNRTTQILVCIIFCSVFAWGQKAEETEKKGITLADLGVTPEQKTQIDVMWKMKREKHLQAVKDLKTLNRFVKDSLISDKEIQESLKKFRLERKKRQEQIDKAEESLIKVLSPKAQLHLTVLGILENGLPRRTMRTQSSKGEVEKKEELVNPAEELQDPQPE